MDEDDAATHDPPTDDTEARNKPSWRRLRQRLFSVGDRERPDRKDESSSHSSHNETIADFLNFDGKPPAAAQVTKGPSGLMQKPHVPRIDLSAVAKWASEEKAAKRFHEGNDIQHFPPRVKKPPRRQDLEVSFSSQAPVVIGIGGDEAPDPPLAVGRMKQSGWPAQRETHHATPTIHANSSAPAVSAQKTIPLRPRDADVMMRGDNASAEANQSVSLNYAARDQFGPISLPMFQSNDRDLVGLNDYPVAVSSDCDFPTRRNDNGAEEKSHAGSIYENRSLPPSLTIDRPARGLRSMRAEEGKALVSASQRRRLSVPEVVAGEEQPNCLTESLQVIPSRLSFDSERTTSQHSNASISTLPGNLPQEDELYSATPLTPVSKAPFSEKNPLLTEFVDRVDHLKSVFRITAQLGQPGPTVSKQEWLRVATWWFLKATRSLEDMVLLRKQEEPTPPMSAHTFSILMQNYVDLAKAWYILSEILLFPAIKLENDRFIAGERSLADQFQGLLGVLDQEQLMPPGNILIQGLDTSIWLQYPSFDPQEESVLSGAIWSSHADPGTTSTNFRNMIPLGDVPETFLFRRAFVQLSLVSKVKQLDIRSFPGIVSTTRQTTDSQISIVIATQKSLVNIHVSGNQRDHLTWEQVRWEGGTRSLRINIGHGLRLNIEFGDADYHSLWTLFDYGRKISQSLQPRQDELFVLKTIFAEFQYTDSAHPQAFSTGKVTDCVGVVLRRTINRGFKERRAHQGYRLAALTSAAEKIQQSVSINLDQHGPIIYELETIAAKPAMTLCVNQGQRERRVVIAFGTEDERSRFQSCLTGQHLSRTDKVVARLPLQDLSVRATPFRGLGSDTSTIKILEWHTLDIITSTNGSNHFPRLLCYNSNGCLAYQNDQAVVQFHLSATHPTGITLMHDIHDETTISLGPHHATTEQYSSTQELAQLLAGRHVDHTTSDSHSSTTPSSNHSNLLVFHYTFPSTSNMHAFQALFTHTTVLLDTTILQISILRKRSLLSRPRTRARSTSSFSDSTAPRTRIQLLRSNSPEESKISLFAFNANDDEDADPASMHVQITGTEKIEQFAEKKGVAVGVRLLGVVVLSLAAGGGANKGGFLELPAPWNSREGHGEETDAAQETEDVALVFASETDRASFLAALAPPSFI